MIDAYRDTDFSLSVEERIRAYLVAVVSDPEYNGFDAEPLRHTDFIETNLEDNATRFKYRVLDFMCNKDRNLHGGAASNL